MTPQDVLQRLEALDQRERTTPGMIASRIAMEEYADVLHDYGPRLVAVARAAHITKFKHAPGSEWVSIPRETFDAIETALAALGEEAGHG